MKPELGKIKRTFHNNVAALILHDETFQGTIFISDDVQDEISEYGITVNMTCLCENSTCR